MKETIKPLFTHWDIVSKRQSRKKLLAFPVLYFFHLTVAGLGSDASRWKEISSFVWTWGEGGQGETWRRAWSWTTRNLELKWRKAFSRCLDKAVSMKEVPWIGPSPQPSRSLNGGIRAIDADISISAIQEHCRCGSTESLTVPSSRLCTKSSVRRADFWVKTIPALIWT